MHVIFGHTEMFLTLAPPPCYFHGNRNGESSGPLRPTGVFGENKRLVQPFQAKPCHPARLRRVQTRTTSALTNQRNGSGQITSFGKPDHVNFFPPAKVIEQTDTRNF